MNRISLLLSALIACAAAGCASQSFRCADGAYAGLGRRFAAASSNGNSVHLVMVHGMTDHEPGYGELFAGEIARRLQLVGQPATNLMMFPGPEGRWTNVLRNFSYARGSNHLFVHELTWTPTTQALKAEAFHEDELLNHRRVSLNRTLKNQVINNGFGDAVLYLNPGFRTNMQQPIRETIEYVVKNSGDQDDIVLVASSLGSKMTFDTVERWGAELPDKFAGRTTDIIMLANQIPLLNLGTRPITPGQPQPPDGSLKTFLLRSQRSKSNRRLKPPDANQPGTNAPYVINVVAATDPNDILSYPLRDRDIPAPTSQGGVEVHVNAANIYAHNAAVWFGFLERPDRAHSDYDKNRWLMRRLVNGFKGSKKSCLKSSDKPPSGAKARKPRNSF